MLWKAADLMNSALQATDGRIGSVADFLFDDERWSVRWLVVDTGSWLSGRKVLVPASHVGQPRADAPVIAVDLTMAQVEASPDVATEEPVSRQMEEQLYGHFGGQPYWTMMPPIAAGSVAGLGYPVTRAMTAPPADAGVDVGAAGDPHLRSMKEVRGYHIRAADGEIGHCEAFLLEDEDWSIRHLIVDTRNWWPGKKVLVQPGWIESVDWSARVLRVGHTREEIKHAPEYDPDRPLAPADERTPAERRNLAGDR
jgi:hypothetical protein